MNRNRKIGITYYISSAVLYICAVINFVGDSSTSIGVMFLCIGSLWLCLGSVYINKPDENDDDSEKKGRKNE